MVRFGFPESRWVLAQQAGEPVEELREDGGATIAFAVRDRNPFLRWLLTFRERAEILDRAAEAVVRHRDELATIIAEEAAKPIKTARVEAERTVITFRSAAIEARTLVGEVVPVEGAAPGEGKLAFTLRVPRGVVAAISVSGLASRITAARVRELGPMVAAAASRISRKLGSPTR